MGRFYQNFELEKRNFESTNLRIEFKFSSPFFEETMTFDQVPGPCPKGRANYNEDDDLQVCPYNPSHTILRHRFGNHLIKCKKQYPNTPMKTCRFNSLHIIHRNEMDEHEKNCEDGKDICRAPTETGFVNVNAPPPSRGSARDVTSESWEVDVGPSYNPNVVMENVPYVRMRMHLSRGEREAWKAQELERIRILKERQERERQEENALPLTPGLTPLEPGSVPAEAEGAAALPPKKADVPKKAPVAPKPNDQYSRPLRRPKNVEGSSYDDLVNNKLGNIKEE